MIAVNGADCIPTDASVSIQPESVNMFGSLCYIYLMITATPGGTLSRKFESTLENMKKLNFPYILVCTALSGECRTTSPYLTSMWL